MSLSSDIHVLVDVDQIDETHLTEMVHHLPFLVLVHLEPIQFHVLRPIVFNKNRLT